LENSWDESRLRCLSLWSLNESRNSEDLLEIFKMTRGKYRTSNRIRQVLSRLIKKAREEVTSLNYEKLLQDRPKVSILFYWNVQQVEQSAS